MKDKKNIYYIIKVIIFAVLLFFCISLVHEVTKRKQPYRIMNDFLNQREEFDVLFFGSSHVYCSVLPLELWNEYGIVSYNMGQANATPAMSYYNMQLACEKTKPKLVVIDAYMASKSYKVYEQNFTYSMHEMFDPYPISYTKYIAIKELCGNRKLMDSEVEFLFNFSLYHNRWKELSEVDFNVNPSVQKGARPEINIAEPKKISEFNSVNVYSGDETINIEYLKKIIEYCQKNNIEILMTYIPFPASNENIAESKYVKTICDEYRVNYLNFLAMEIVNYDIDCYDSYSHLNPSGAKKATNYLGKYIRDNYDISDKRKKEEYNFWNEDYKKYIELKINNLKNNRNNLNNYLMLLYGEEDIKYEIKISSKKVIKEGSTLQKLLLNLNNNYQIEDSAFEEHQDKTIKITTYNNRSGKLIDTVWF